MDITVDCNEVYYEVFKARSGDTTRVDVRLSPRNGSGGLFLRDIKLAEFDKALQRLKP